MNATLCMQTNTSVDKQTENTPQKISIWGSLNKFILNHTCLALIRYTNFDNFVFLFTIWGNQKSFQMSVYLTEFLSYHYLWSYINNYKSI